MGLVCLCGRVTDYHTCRSESREDTETHGEGEFGTAGEIPDQTHTHQTPPAQGNRTAPQIKMHPGHSICVPLPSSHCAKTSFLQEKSFFLTFNVTEPERIAEMHVLKCK